MLTLHQKALVYLILILATIVWRWPVGILMTFFFIDVNHHIPIRYPIENDPE